MAANPVLRAFKKLLGENTLLNLSGEPGHEDAPDSSIISLGLEQPDKPQTTAVAVVEKQIEPIGSSVAVVDLGGTSAVSKIYRNANYQLFRNYAKYSTWVRAAIDHYRGAIGRSHFDIVQIDTTAKPKRIDRNVKAAVEDLLRHPNAADESYGTLKEQLVEDYLVIGHGCIELELNRDLTARSMRILDAAKIGFVKAWDGTDRSVPRFAEFKENNSSIISRYLAHEQVFCHINRPMSDTKLGFSHVEALHRSVMALLSGDEFLLKQLVQPIPDSLLSLGEGVTAQQVEQFKYQIQSVRDKLAIIGGTKNAQVIRLSGSAEEMKILDSQEWFVRQVAAIFGISTAKLKLAVDTSRANTEAMYDDDAEAISMEIRRVEELETSTFINRYSYLGDINLKFSYPILQQKDEVKQAEIAKKQTGQPWASINEARMRTGEKALEESEFPFANEPLINMGGKNPPLPISVYTEFIENFRKNIGKAPEPTTQPPADDPDKDDQETDEESTDDSQQ